MRRTAHIQEEDLRTYLLGRAQPEDVLVTEAHVQGCTECQNRLTEARLAPQLSDAAEGQNGVVDKRAEGRFGIEDIVILQPLSSERLSAKIIDVSKTGLAIVTSQNLPCGTSVRIRIGRKVFVAEVRYCRPSGAEFQIGLFVQNMRDADWTL